MTPSWKTRACPRNAQVLHREPRKLDFLARDEKAVGTLRALEWHFAELPLITTGQRFPLPLESQHQQNNRARHANPDGHKQRYFPMR